MIKRDDLILCPMHNEYRTADVGCIIDIGEFIPHHCKSEIECDTKGGEEGRLEYDARDAPPLPRSFGREVAARTGSEGSTIEDDFFRLYLADLE
eukprot:CAMPEP_0197255492 /NCGR_PEP_ID=MMETSP1429-20130617/72282_1 /TAXON_ID=49237 /ORGANISM="Chaetoceros  sp., Strain UNC1202" /LENGTH=93 /DNA_ID=CAMNT_0042718807 /DNA_START=28 /DNA_END=309 /DNA_ORIENTATION=-